MEELRDRYYGGEGQSRDAFEELCAMYDAIQVFRIYDTSPACISLEILVQRPFTSINRFVVTMSIKWNDLEFKLSLKKSNAELCVMDKPLHLIVLSCNESNEQLTW